MIFCKKRVITLDYNEIVILLDAVQQLLIVTIPSIFAILLVYLTNRINTKTKLDDIHRNSLERRIDKLYSPFFKEIYIAIKFKCAPFEYPKETLTNICRILIDNISFAESLTQSKILSFYARYNDLINGLEIKHTLPDFESHDFMVDFMTMYDSIYKEYTDICDKLSLSEPVNCLEEYDHYVLKF